MSLIQPDGSRPPGAGLDIRKPHRSFDVRYVPQEQPVHACSCGRPALDGRLRYSILVQAVEGTPDRSTVRVALRTLAVRIEGPPFVLDRLQVDVTECAGGKRSPELWCWVRREGGLVGHATVE